MIHEEHLVNWYVTLPPSVHGFHKLSFHLQSRCLKFHSPLRRCHNLHHDYVRCRATKLTHTILSFCLAV